jgi:IS5 family transposase
MVNILDGLTHLYVFVDDVLKQSPHLANWRRSSNSRPKFSDAEVITIGLLQPLLGLSSLKHAHQLVYHNYRSCFPQVCAYPQWIRRLQMLSPILAKLFAVVAYESLRQDSQPLYVIDSKPLPVVSRIRIASARLLRDDGASFGKTSAGWFFGFKLHVLEHQPSGVIVDAMLTPAGMNDRFGLSMCERVAGGSYLIADEGYNGHRVFDALVKDWGVVRVLPSDKSGVTEPGTKRRFRFTQISALRQRVETTFSQLWRKHIDRISSRSWLGLWVKTLLNLVFYNIRQAAFLPL